MTFAIFNGFLRCLIFLFVLISFTLLPSKYSSYALSMNNSNNTTVVEELRLNVPLEYKNTWLKAEAEIWEPWLEQKKGYKGRQIFYDENKEEALVLVTWEDKKLWKSISTEDVKKVQTIFEENVKESLKLTKNPFELIYEGELFIENV